MKNIKKMAALSLALSFSFLGQESLVNPVNSYAKEESLAIQNADLGVDKGKGEYIEETINLKQSQDEIEYFLNEIRDIRSKLWDSNIPYVSVSPDGTGGESKSLRESAEKSGYTTMKDYAFGLKWRTDLEKIAIQRAFEQKYSDSSDTRPDGSNFKSATINGIHSDVELVSKSKLDGGIKSYGKWSFANYQTGQSKYDKLLAANGKLTPENFELHTLLNPGIKYIGYAQVADEETNTLYEVVELSYDMNSKMDSSNDQVTNLVGPYTLSIGDKNYKEDKDKTQKDKLEKLKISYQKAQEIIKGAEILKESMPNFSNENSARINELVEKQKEVIKKAENVLKENGLI
ncbi:hypothetical protein ACCQ41_07165 [Anaerococcus sp. ENR0831]|uniref:Uncharacterized protein n=1 Tax=Anaerococcus martiniensis TaxID=3115615 RepID=A0ABW9MBP4_9FIRM